MRFVDEVSPYPQEIVTGRTESRLLLVLVLATMLEALATLLVLLSAPAILKAFDMPVASSGSLLTAFYLPLVALMPVWASLGGALGRKQVFLVALAIYVVGSLIAATAMSFNWLILGRAIQGVGSSAHGPLSIAILGDVIPIQRRGRAMGVWETAGSLSIFGVLVGGYLVDAWGWRTIFIATAFVALLVLGLARHSLPVFPRTGRMAIIDWRGAASFTAGMILIVTVLSNVQDWGWLTPRSVTVFLAGGLAIVLTPAIHRRSAEPFLDRGLFAVRPFLFSSLAAVGPALALTGATLTIPLYLDAIHQVGASGLGLFLTLNAMGLFAGTVLGGLATDRWGSRVPGITGLSLLGAALFGIGAITGTGVALVVAAFVTAGFAAGLTLPAFTMVITQAFRSELLGRASGVYALIRRTGTILGAALSASILGYRLNVPTAGLDPASERILAYRETFWFLGVVAFAALLPALRLSLRPRATEPDPLVQTRVG